MIQINVNSNLGLKFDFNKYVSLIFSAIPDKHLVYLNQINFVDSYDKSIGCDKHSLGCYYFIRKEGVVLINLGNLTKDKIPIYIFNYYAEVASLFLSKIIGHEVGHHVARFWKHGIKDQESYANKYAESCYFNYLGSRRKMILFSFFLGEINVLDFSKEDRTIFRQRRKEHSAWFRRKTREKGAYLYP